MAGNFSFPGQVAGKRIRAEGHSLELYYKYGAFSLVQKNRLHFIVEFAVTSPYQILNC